MRLLNKYVGGKKIEKVNYLIGNIIDMKNGQVEILDIGRYKNNNKKYTIKCLKCKGIRTIGDKGILNKSECINCSKNKFKLSDDGTYWIGTTQDGVDFWFDGDEETIAYVKSKTWSMSNGNNSYIRNGKHERLHRIIMGVTDPNIYVNHLGGNRWDNRKSSLSISDCVDNTKERNKTSNSSGIVGLRGNGKKWFGNVNINNRLMYSMTKEKKEALIDLLIMQREYGYRHNIDKYHLLENIPQERIDEILTLIKNQLEIHKTPQIIAKNKYELSECGTYYNVYDKKGSSFKISIEDKNKIENGIWYISGRYVYGAIIINNTKIRVSLHRYLHNLLDIKYKNFFIDHLNGIGTDNRISNLQITNLKGNNQNQPGLGYVEVKGSYKAFITVNGKYKCKTFKTIKEAMYWRKEQKELAMDNRTTFKNKQEIDEYLKIVQTQEESLLLIQ